MDAAAATWAEPPAKRTHFPSPSTRFADCDPRSLFRACVDARRCCSLCFRSVATVSLSYYKGERAMIDCVQEYEQRAKAKARKQRQLREEAAAAGLAQQQ